MPRGTRLAGGCLALALLTPAVTPSAGATESASPAGTASAITAAVPRQASEHYPRFTATVSRVTRRQLGRSWHRGCPVPPSRLRRLRVRYVGFDHDAHRGTLVVNAAAVQALTVALHRIYRHRFPIRRIRPVSAYRGSDNRSMRHDNTSAFNCRYAVANGPKQWSMHAYGEAIDINPRENPYLLDGRVHPPQGRRYVDRSRWRRGMIRAGSVPVRAFASVGWGWGGTWSSSPDYQHFSVNGH